jgi:hypothetical protein
LIATELVKFLAIKTSFVAIDKLTSKAAALELKTSKSKKEVAVAVKAAALAANKANECKTKLNSVLKQLQMLEGKVGK